MKIELIGTVHKGGHWFWKKPGVSWELWLNENIRISSGFAASVKKAEQAATKAFEIYKQRLAACKKPIRFQEWA